MKKEFEISTPSIYHPLTFPFITSFIYCLFLCSRRNLISSSTLMASHEDKCRHHFSLRMKNFLIGFFCVCVLFLSLHQGKISTHVNIILKLRLCCHVFVTKLFFLSFERSFSLSIHMLVSFTTSYSHMYTIFFNSNSNIDI